MTINGYFIGRYFINGYWCLLMVIILMAISGYFIGGYSISDIHYYSINGDYWIFFWWIVANQK